MSNYWGIYYVENDAPIRMGWSKKIQTNRKAGRRIFYRSIWMQILYGEDM